MNPEKFHLVPPVKKSGLDNNPKMCYNKGGFFFFFLFCEFFRDFSDLFSQFFRSSPKNRVILGEKIGFSDEFFDIFFGFLRFFRPDFLYALFKMGRPPAGHAAGAPIGSALWIFFHGQCDRFSGYEFPKKIGP